MYTKYAYLSGITQANLLNDIVLLLTGTTDKATLSASCDQANTEILTPYSVAGWTLHDAIAGTNAVVVKAPCVGDAAQFKYVEINTNTSGQVFTGLWESWNDTSHVGTNLASQSKTSGYGQRYATATSGTIYIFASAQRIIMWGVSSAGNGTTNTLGYGGVFEFDRGYSWCAVGQGFTPVAYTIGSTAYSPRFLDSSGAIQSASGQVAYIVGMGGSMESGSGRKIAGTAGVQMASGFATPLSPIAGHAQQITGFSFSGANASDLLMYVGTTANWLDETTYNSKVYVMLSYDSSGASNPKLAVPKG